MSMPEISPMEIPSCQDEQVLQNGTEDVFKMPLPPIESKSLCTSPGYKIMYNLSGHEHCVTSVKFSLDGDTLVSASNDSIIKIWDMLAIECKQTFGGHTKGVNDVAWSPGSRGGHILASCSDDESIRLWDTRIADCFMKMTGHSGYVFACRFHPQANILASTSYDESVRLWDLRVGRCLRKIEAHWDPITSVDFNCDGSLFVTSSFDGLVRIWDTSSGQVVKTLIDDDNTPVCYVKFSPNGKYILVSTMNSTLKLWNFQKPKCLRTYTGHQNERYCLSSHFSVTSGRWVVSSSEDNSICIWNLQTKELVQKLDTLNDMPLCIDCHPRANVIVSGAVQNTYSIKIWQSSEQ